MKLTAFALPPAILGLIASLFVLSCQFRNQSDTKTNKTKKWTNSQDSVVRCVRKHTLHPLAPECMNLLGADPNLKRPERGAVTDQTFALSNASIVWLNYGLLRQNFPQLKKMKRREIDDLILQNSAWISADQVTFGEKNGVNTDIPLVPLKDSAGRAQKWSQPAVPVVDWRNSREAETKVDPQVLKSREGRVQDLMKHVVSRPALRPLSYLRAHVLELQHDGKALGLLDIKGAGGSIPAAIVDGETRHYNGPSHIHGGHGNGLATLGEAIRECVWGEFLYELSTIERRSRDYKKSLQSYLKNSPFPFPKNVRCYAVVFAGFDAIFEGKSYHAGLIVREATVRNRSDVKAAWCKKHNAEAICKNTSRKGLIAPLQALATMYQFSTSWELTSTGGIIDYGSVSPVVPVPQAKGLEMEVPDLVRIKKNPKMTFMRGHEPTTPVRLPLRDPLASDAWGGKIIGEVGYRDALFKHSQQLAASFVTQVDISGKRITDETIRRSWVNDHFVRAIGPVLKKLGVDYTGSGFWTP